MTWDEEMIYGCVCDSSWEVGLGSGQTQEPEWFGPDCSLRHCPSGDDPSTTVDETDCYNATTSSVYSGAAVGIFHMTVLLCRARRNRMDEESQGAPSQRAGLFLSITVRTLLILLLFNLDLTSMRAVNLCRSKESAERIFTQGSGQEKA